VYVLVIVGGGKGGGRSGARVYECVLSLEESCPLAFEVM
jgi:hypothetical protein